MTEFQKNMYEYSQKWFKLKGFARKTELEGDPIIQKRLEAHQLLGQLWQDCMLLRMREAGL